MAARGQTNDFTAIRLLVELQIRRDNQSSDSPKLRRRKRRAGGGLQHDRRMFCTLSSRSPRHLLVVEPDPLFRLLLCAAMAGEFADFHAVATYSEARALLAEHEFAAIVAENDLAGGAGLSLYEEVRCLKPTLPFALMCAGITVTHDDPQFRCFPKPFGVSELTVALVQMIAFVGGR